MLRYNQYSFILLSDSMIQLVQSNAEKVDEIHKIKLLTDDIIRQMYMTLKLSKWGADVGGQGQWKSGQLSVSSLSGRTDRHRTAFFTKFRTESLQNPDRQTPDRKSRQNLDSRQTLDTIFRKTGQKRDKDRTRTVLSADVWWGVIQDFRNVLYLNKDTTWR